MGFDEFSNDVEFLWRKAAILTEIDRFQPKFAYQFIPLHIDVFWFAAIEAVKEEAIGTWDIFDTWHLFLVKPNLVCEKVLGALQFSRLRGYNINQDCLIF